MFRLFAIFVFVFSTAFSGPGLSQPGPGTELFPTFSEEDIEILLLEDLSFGTLSPSPHSSGFVEINPQSGNRIISGDVVEVGGLYAPARFLIRGEPLRHVQIILPSEVTAETPGGPVRIYNLATNVENPARLDERGELEIFVGGRLEVPAGHSEKNVQASFPLTVEYFGPDF